MAKVHDNKDHFDFVGVSRDIPDGLADYIFDNFNKWGVKDQRTTYFTYRDREGVRMIRSYNAVSEHDHDEVVKEVKKIISAGLDKDGKRAWKGVWQDASEREDQAND
ncbi:hypothetical protein ANO11243_092730 [Dothideomycetidae sp. 11243]|nr:hypothetical protein ANO11243_092730 [fungal sp. No.11243]